MAPDVSSLPLFAAADQRAAASHALGKAYSEEHEAEKALEDCPPRDRPSRTRRLRRARDEVMRLRALAGR